MRIRTKIRVKSTVQMLQEDSDVQRGSGNLLASDYSPTEEGRHLPACTSRPTVPGARLAFWKYILNEWMILFVWKIKG